MVVIDDDWRAEGAVNPGYGLWVGTTAFTMVVMGGQAGRQEELGGAPPMVETRTRGGRAGGSGDSVQAPSLEAKLSAESYTDGVVEFDGSSRSWLELTKLGNDLKLGKSCWVRQRGG